MDLALFDFDGTITFSDTFTPFVRGAVGRLRRLAGLVVLSPAIVGYKLQLLSATRVRQSVVRVAFGGMNERELTERGEQYAREVLPTVVRPDVLERIE
jgi:hypothetical protein